MAWSLLLYNAVNVYTDIRTRKTKNLWHLLFLIAAVGLLIWQIPPLFSWLKVIFIALAIFPWLIIGLLCEHIRLFSPGDTKMLVVNGAWITVLSYLLVGWEYVIPTMLQFAVLLIIAFLVGGVSLTIWRFGWKALIMSLYTRQTLKKEGGKNLSMPGAVPISLAVLVTTISMMW